MKRLKKLQRSDRDPFYGSLSSSNYLSDSGQLSVFCLVYGSDNGE